MSTNPMWPEDAPLSSEEYAAVLQLHRDGLIDGPPPELGQLPEVRTLDDEIADADRRDGGFDSLPLNYERLIAEGLPEVQYLDRPYIPAGTSIWAAGPAESGKSIFALWVSCRLSRARVRVVYITPRTTSST
jgi:hypothetical protein